MSAWKRWGIGLVVLLALTFRFARLDGKPPWFDETVTALRISGHTERDLHEHFGTAPVFTTSSELLRFQRPQPGTSSAHVIAGLAREEPQHQPLYYLCVRWWVQLMGGTLFRLRAASGLLALAALPAALWLCRECFWHRWRGPFALFALSPLQLVFARTAREYGVWVGVSLGASAALLYALRTNNLRSTTLYGLLMAAASQFFIFTWLLLGGHLLFLLLFRPDGADIPAHRRLWQRRRWVASGCLGCCTSLPWLIGTRGGQLDGTQSWALRPRAPVDMMQAWGAEFLRAFVDYDVQRDSNAGLLVVLAVLGLLLAGVYLLRTSRLLRKRSEPELLLVCLSIGNCLPLLAIDLSIGGQLSAVARFQAPALAVATLLVGAALHSPSWRNAKGAILIVLGVTELSSSLHLVSSNTWWHKAPNNAAVEVAQTVNQAGDSITLVSDGWAGDALSLAWLTASTQRWLVRFTPFQGVDAHLSQRSPPPDPSSAFWLYYDPRGYTVGSFRDWLSAQRGDGSAEPVLSIDGRVALWRIVNREQKPSGTRD